MRKILIPDIGDFENVAVVEVLMRAGDTVAAEDSLLTLESDKATMDVPSPSAGRIVAVHVGPGDKVSAGSHIADMEEGAAADADTSESEAPSATDSPADAQPASGSANQPEEGAGSAASAGAPGEAQEVRVPDIGDFENVAVIEVLISAGDTIAAEDSLLTLESDKATMDVPAPFAGTVTEVLVSAGDKVSAGALIARVTSGSSAGSKKSDGPKGGAKTAPPKSEPATDAAPHDNPPTSNVRSASETAARPPLTPVVESDKSFAKPHASPAVRKFAREIGADMHKIKGSGARGRILKTDVQEFVKAQLARKDSGGSGLPQMPEVDFAQFGEVELHPLPRIRRLSAENLHRNWLLAPHVTQCGEADITDMENFRQSLSQEAKRDGYRMTPLAFFIRAAVMALREFPEFNASLSADGEHAVRKKYFHIGVAVDTPGGLVVPVLRDADRKGLKDIARELGEISVRAREGKLKSEEMRGGCFTISSLGGIGGSFFTPIINLPEVAIMGVSRSQMRPHWTGTEFVPRLILPLSLSYDHRLIDGAAGARFIVHFASLLGDIRRLSL